jgi:hypothetical protein
LKLIYIDEAGNTGSHADPDQPIHMIGALIVDQARIRSIEVRLNGLAEKAASLSGAAGHPVTAGNVEFHGADMFGGKKIFARLTPTERVAMCSDVISACRDGDAVFGYCAVDKLKSQSGHPHMRCFQFMLERVQDYLSLSGDLGLIVADEHRELEEDIIQDLAFSKEFSTTWGYRPTPIINIVDTVHFVKSRHNRLVQACDVLTYFRLKKLRLHARIVETWMALSDKSAVDFKNFTDGLVSQSERAVLDLAEAIRPFDTGQRGC